VAAGVAVTGVPVVGVVPVAHVYVYAVPELAANVTVCPVHIGFGVAVTEIGSGGLALIALIKTY
jgi:hypothetical protein